MIPLRIVLDTNVLVSAVLYPNNPVGHILNLAAEERLTLVLSPFILHEVEYVLARIGFEKSKIRETLNALEDLAEIVKPVQTLHVIKNDPPDNHILECAVEGKVQVLVTGDKKHI